MKWALLRPFRNVGNAPSYARRLSLSRNRPFQPMTREPWELDADAWKQSSEVEIRAAAYALLQRMVRDKLETQD
jgi:hypothetical protein